ncbi:PIR Superfamily Protein [Plasmodium ovale wallikeri]|uniref:PIR Superfamily Protein n=1 Tax=Plasmodium ovale wallikeri TaxID=864142 RepID=A0A1A9ATI2_PLAOA|nr:PIR Superfamily Protein [Plasmodium ovale wallikeri]
MDTERWQQEYPFLNKIWDLYKEFDNPPLEYKFLEFDDKCSFIIEGQNEHKDTCVKLFKNLWSITDEINENLGENERCTYFNMWLYYQAEKYKIPENVIEKIFHIVENIALINLEEYSICKYDSYKKKHIEPEKIIVLNTFLDNIYTVETILDSQDKENYDSCKKYVRECAAIYEQMNAMYCSDDVNRKVKFRNICQELQTFELMYTSVLYNKLKMGEKLLPSLTPLGIIPRQLPVKQQEEDWVLIPGQRYQTKSLALQRLLRKVPALIGIAIGTSFLLLILYKFTSLGSWLRAKKRKKRSMSNKMDDDEEIQQLMFGISQYDNVNLYEMGYNMGYQPVRNFSFDYNIE